MHNRTAPITKITADHRHPARAIKPRLGPRQRLAVDGGVKAHTAPACVEAGCDVLAAASAIFGSDDYAEAIAALRGPARVATGND